MQGFIRSPSSYNMDSDDDYDPEYFDYYSMDFDAWIMDVCPGKIPCALSAIRLEPEENLIEVVQDLVARGCPVDGMNKDGMRGLAYAVRLRWSKVASELLKLGADVHLVRMQDAVTEAAHDGKTECLSVLLAHGAMIADSVIDRARAMFDNPASECWPDWPPRTAAQKSEYSARVVELLVKTRANRRIRRLARLARLVGRIALFVRALHSEVKYRPGNSGAEACRARFEANAAAAESSDARKKPRLE